MAASVSHFDIGDAVRFTGSFTDPEDVPADPSTVTFRLKDPDGNVADYEFSSGSLIVRDSAGEYHIDLPIDDSGKWYYRWEGTGDVQAVEEASISVRRSKVI